MQPLLRAWLPVIVVVLAGLPLAAGSIPIGKAEDVGMSTERLKRIGVKPFSATSRLAMLLVP